MKDIKKLYIAHKLEPNVKLKWNDGLVFTNLKKSSGNQKPQTQEKKPNLQSIYHISEIELFQ